jgi:MoaA/NifB/PqqE/SkfB family radical SAM enzyme
MEWWRDLRFAWGIARRRPFDVLIQVTNRCNMRCSFCDFWPNGAKPEQELQLDDFRRLAADLRQLGCFLVSLEGGEPFLRPELVDIVAAFADAGHLTTLYTNGWYVTAENAQALFAAGLTQVGVSIDYPQAEDHDTKRCLPGTTERAWAAVELLRDAAPHAGKQVHVMTVVMDSNWQAIEPLLEQSLQRGIGHCFTLLSTGGYRRGERGPDQLPPPECGPHLAALWDRYPHVRFLREYFTQMEPFLAGGEMPTCRAGTQSFNVDHLGNVSSCIERIDRPVGNLRQTPLRELYAMLASAGEAGNDGCQDCWTACRGLVQLMGQGGTTSNWRQLSARMKSR